MTQVARLQGSQIVAASHSEVVLNEAAGRDMVIAFVGKTPHRIDDRGGQVFKALAEIGYDQYYQAEQTGWVLYLEGSTHLAILQAFARKLRHPVARYLDQPFVNYVSNHPPKARDHFFGLREAKRDLVGVAIYDRLDRELQQPPGLREITWHRREDDFLDRLFETYFKRLELPNLMRKSDYHLLAEYVPESLISSDVRDVLDAIAVVAQHAHPMEE